MRRRDFVSAAALAGAATTIVAQTGNPPSRKGRLKQCVTRFPFDPKMPFEDMCRHAAELGCVGFDLVASKDWPTLKKYGLISTMAPMRGVTMEDGIIHKETHDKFLESMGSAIDECATGG